MERKGNKRWSAAAATAMALALLPSGPAWAASTIVDTGTTASTPSEPHNSERHPAPPDPASPYPPRVERPDSKLPKGWRTSDDRAVTVVGDSRGLHVLVADSAEAYQWQEVAALREDGFDTDAWVGNVCVTGSGKRAVVAYAPRAFTNTPALFDRGAFAAVVDLGTHKVTKLREQVSLAYFNPGCGTGETAVLTQSADEEVGRTRLLRLNTATGKVSGMVTVPGQATSAVPVGNATVAAIGNRLTRIAADGSTELIGRTSGPAFRIHPDADGGVAFLDRDDTEVTVRRAQGGRLSALAHGTLGKVGLSAGTAGRLFLTGTPEDVAQLPDTIDRLSADAGTEVSSHGRLVIERAVSEGLRSHVTNPLAATGDNSSLPYTVNARVPATGEKLEFTVAPDTAPAAERPSPALRPGAAASARAADGGKLVAADSSTTTYDSERTCSIPRNDPNQQALQPTPNQVEWAVDMAVRGNLTSGYITQGGWRAQAGLGSSVSPSTMFPIPELKGAAAGKRIPAQVLLGVLAQESNMWQASYHAMPGQTGNPLIGNFYGTNIYPGTTGYDPDKVWSVDWTKADCGYGMGQQTDGMSTAARQVPGKPAAFPEPQQRAIALDYTANVAVAAQTLANKWNELHTAGQTVKINDDDPQNIENWFAAVWNYNLGFNAPDSTGKWGLGWLNNPANPKYPADRDAFLDNNHYSDAAQPQKWPYPEKVMGWAAYPIDTGRSYSDAGAQNNGNTHGYQAAWWNDPGYRSLAIKPPLSAFCNSTNGCDAASPPVCTTEACYTQYWYDGDAKWASCSGTCGFETLTYKTLRTELGRGDSGTPECGIGGLPSGAASSAIIVDDVADSVGTFRTDCTKAYISNGSLTWKFAANSGTYEGKEDLHQVGGGLGSHFWFAHTRDDQHRIAQMKVTGTWTLGRSLDQWVRVLVHLPDTGAESQQAHYRINLGNGVSRERYLNQRSKRNQWVELGAYRFKGTPSVSLDNESVDGTADNDVAWDAIAFQPLTAKPRMVVAMGDSYASGEGAGSYAPTSDVDNGKATWNACRRSANSWARKTTVPGFSDTIGTLSDTASASLDFQDVSCSGAHTWQLLPGTPVNGDEVETWGFDGNFHEKFQSESGVLSEDTDLVALTIGGNDAGFPAVMQSCATTGCPAEDSVHADIDDTMPEIEKVLREINSAAPNAKIILLGYPRLFNEDVTLCVSGVGGAGMIRVNNMGEYMESKQQQLVASLKSAGLPVSYESPDSDFEGKRACDDNEGINKIVTGQNGDGDFSCKVGGTWCISRESYHPNSVGTSAYSAAFRRALGKL
ncbi:GDSL-type esterase/lipase family protein [Streptomyces sp. ME02-8801-2C]|uniref:GDSL-type esterase/lipase family protein n=1 Tax=Streptomyces sp. ME02-8801-2C TaxID=3028680 RepID=UPI0029B8668C|nr:GDSL-type esterase/lipase family protein [Streptomyces sp. ME02-8801-2C]MDX3456140.1 GDSL-type esterase/lipase family protein [Streptomyces sp. ME02-8801-2C]